MDHGQIQDIGTHDELVQRNQMYREIYEFQQKAGDEN